MGRWGRIAAAFAAVVTPASVFALAAPGSASALSASTNVGNTGQSTLSYIDREITAGTGGFAYLRSTPAGRSEQWWGFPTGSFGPYQLTGIPATDYVVGVDNGLVVGTNFGTDTVDWQDVHGNSVSNTAGSGTLIPSGNPDYTADSSLTISAAPGGWVTIGDTIVPSGSTTPSSAHLLLVTTGGSVTDLATLGDLPTNTYWNVVGGPNGVIYQSSTYDSTTSTTTNSPWIYVPYATPTSPVTLASDTSAYNCQSVFASDALCSKMNSSGAPVDVLVPLDGSADSSLTLNGNAIFATGTASDAAWIDYTTHDIELEPWAGGGVTIVSTGAAIPSADLASDGTNLIFAAAMNAPTAGVAEMTPSTSTKVTGLNGEPIAATEAGTLSLTPGRVTWTDDHPATSTLAAGAGPLWDRTLTNSSGTLNAGSSANLVVTDASDYGLSYGPPLSVSGRRTLYTNNLNNLVVLDPAASTTKVTLGSGKYARTNLSGSRVLWFDNSGTGAWKLRDLNTGTDANLSSTIANGDSATLWGNYIAFEKQTDGSVWRWDISSLSNLPVQVLASPDTTSKTCSNNGGPFVAGDYVAWSEGCSDPNTYQDLGFVSGYENATAGSAAVDMSSSGSVLAMSGSYIATGSGFPYPQNSVPISVTQLGTTTTSSPGSATGPIALDGSTLAWVDGAGAVQAESLTYVPEVPRYLGNGVAPSAIALPGTWNGEWDASGALSSCNVAITQGSTAVATVPCNTADMAFGEAVASWNGKDTGGAQVADGNYTWTLNAAGPDGALAAPNGSALTLTGSINVSSPLVITTASLPGAVVNSPYNASVAATGGTGPYTYSVTSGTLPAGLSLNSSTGAITGTPTTAGNSPVTFQATDSATPLPATASKALSITVNPAVSISSTSLPVGVVNTPYNASVAATGGTTPYTYAVTSGNMPPGLNLDTSTGAITGTPTALGSTAVTFQVTDSTAPTPGTDSKALTVTINPPPPNRPTGVTATAGVDSATLSWTAPASGPAVNSYVVMSNPPTSNVNAGSTSATVTGLTPGVDYTFIVEAVGAGGNSAPSDPSNGVVPTSVAAQNTQSNTGTDPSATTSTPSSSSPTGNVTVTANATGTGTVTVSTYSSDPVAGFEAGATYFDVSTASGNSFSSLSFKVCGLATGDKVSWWNPSAQAWQAVSGAGPIDSSGCSTVTVDSTTSPNLSQLNGTIFAVGLPSQGYTMVAADGGVFPVGGAPLFGSMAGKALNAPVVGMAKTPDGGGYWLVSSDGGVFNFGDATYYGSKVSQHLNAPIVGIASTPSGKGYWLVGADGGVFNFGDAVYYGGEGGTHLNKPVVGIAADPTTGGYWLVASDGGIFNFNAPYEGSTGNRVLNKPVVGMAVDSTTGGYWLVASDGGIFNFNAPYEGSTGNRVLNKPVVGMAADPNSGGYWLFASDGGVFNFGAPYDGSLAGMHLNKPIVGGAAG